MNTLEALARACLTASPAEAAHVIDAQDPADAALAIAPLPIKTTAPVLDRLSPVVCARILEHVSRERTSALMQSMQPLEAAALLPHLSETARAEILVALPERTLRQLQELSRYSQSQAGGMMDPNVVAIPEDLSVKQAIAMVRKAPRQSLYYFYVIDRDRVLKGVVSMRELLLSRPTTKIRTILIAEVVSIPATMAQRDVAQFMRQRRFLALPVVDAENRLIGVVKHDRALSAAHDHAFEDLQKMFGAGAHEQALSPVRTAIARRLPWLLVNLATAFVAAAVVLPFVSTIAEVAALAVLLPVVLSQAHSTGSQTLAVVMRGLAVHELGPGKGRRVLAKEMVAGLCNGLAVAVCATSIVLVLQWPHWRMGVAIGLALTVSMAASATAAASIPLVLRFFGRDPAQAAAIAMTTVTDVIAIGSFLGIAVALL